MTAEWIREAADKAFPDHLVTVAGVTVVGVSRADERSAFIAGVAAGLAKAAEILDEPYRLWSGDFRTPDGTWTRGPHVRLDEDTENSPRENTLGVADWLRALGSDEKSEGQ